MTNYSGSDKLVGTLLSTIPVGAVIPPLFYWENVKTLSVERLGFSVYISGGEETQSYEGFGRESFKDSEVQCAIFNLQSSPNTLANEAAFEQYLSVVHDVINQYNNSSQTDTISGNPVVWVKIISEDREDEVRGIILYRVIFEVRVYIKPVITTAGSTNAGIMQLMVNFLSGVTGFNPIPFSEIKSLDVSRSGNTLIIHAPSVSGRVMGIGTGIDYGQYGQQQISQYTFKVRMYSTTENGIVSSTDWIAANAATYFLNAPFGNGQTIWGKMLGYSMILNERGVWMRDVEILLEVIVGQ